MAEYGPRYLSTIEDIGDGIMVNGLHLDYEGAMKLAYWLMARSVRRLKEPVRVNHLPEPTAAPTSPNPP